MFGCKKDSLVVEGSGGEGGAFLLHKSKFGKFLQIDLSLSKEAPTLVKCMCAPVTVLPDDVSQLAPRGHPLSKRPLFRPQQLLSEEAREGWWWGGGRGGQSHQLQNSPDSD